MLVDSILHPHNVGVRRTKRTVADASSVLASTTSKSHTLHRHDILPTALYYNSCCIYPVPEHVDYMLDTHVFMRRGSGVQDDLHRNIPVSNSHLKYVSVFKSCPKILAQEVPLSNRTHHEARHERLQADIDIKRKPTGTKGSAGDDGAQSTQISLAYSLAPTNKPNNKGTLKHASNTTTNIAAHVQMRDNNFSPPTPRYSQHQIHRNTRSTPCRERAHCIHDGRAASLGYMIPLRFFATDTPVSCR